MQNKGYPADWLEKLKYNSGIVQTLSRYVTLTRKGNTYWACCPFHHEKTASFAVNQQGQFYHCFGCGVSGDVISFVKAIEGVEFNEAVKILAGHAGMEVPEFTESEELLAKRKKRELLQNICRDTAIYYNATLKGTYGKQGLDYLSKRGVSPSTITKLGIGYSSNWNGLVYHLKKLGYKDADLVEAGVCGEKNGKLFDEMAFRVVFPVIDHTGKVVGFSGRALNGEAYAKYKNTKQTPVFNKSFNIYCVNFLRKARLEKNYAILVEGQMDVVALQQAGFNNAIATMGTAFNKNHVQTLKRFVDAVVICFDGDNAGQKATIRSLEPLLDEGLEIKVLSLPEKTDPDEYIKKYGAEKFEGLINNALPLYEFEIKYEASKFDLTNKNNVPKFIDNAIKIVSQIPKVTEREIYINLISSITGVIKETLLRQLNGMLNKKIDTESQSQNVNETDYTSNYKAEQFVLASIIHKKNYILSVDEDDFANNNFRQIYNYIVANNFPIVSKLFDDFNMEESVELKKLIDFNFDIVKKPEVEFVGCLTKMQLAKLEKQQENLNAQIEKCTSDEEKLNLLKRAGEISKKIYEKKTLLNKVGE